MMQTAVLNCIDYDAPKDLDNSSNSVMLTNGTPSIQSGLLDYPEISSTELSVERVDEKVERTIAYLRAHKEQTLIQKISSETDFEPGVINDTISYFGALFSYGKMAVVMWAGRLFVDYYSSDRIVKGLLYIATYYSCEFERMDSLMATAAISNKNDEVKEMAVRVLESNCNLANYQILLTLDVHEAWLRDYIDDVIRDFQNELCLS